MAPNGEPNLFAEPMAYLAFTSRKGLAEAGFELFQITTRDRTPQIGPLSTFIAEPTVADGATEKPPIVFVHGSGDQAGTWVAVAPTFAAERRVVLPDLAGHGESAPAEGPLAFDLVLAGFDRVMDATLDRDRPAVLVGNSMGAWVASLWARANPERVERLVLVNGGPLRHVPEDLTLLPVDRDEARKLMAALRDPASPPIPEFVLDDLVEQAPRGPIGRLSAEMERMEAHLLTADDLAELPVPVEIVWGMSDDYMGMDYAHTLARLLPRARLTEIERCGHIPQSECPDRMLAALREILSQPPPTGPATRSDVIEESKSEELRGEEPDDPEVGGKGTEIEGASDATEEGGEG